MKKKLLILGPCLLFAGLLGAPAAQASTLPPTLAGETFTADQGPGSAVLSCNSDGSGSFTFHASGAAAGPYAGTFVEDKTVTNAAPSPDQYTLLTYHATFTITSPAGTVTGTKDFVPGSPGIGSCVTRHHIGGYFDAPSVTYSATIVSAGHSYTDSGTATATDVLSGRPVKPAVEYFLTSNGLLPTAKDECKEDAWMDYPQFKNQGQCIAYVNHQVQS